MALATMKASDWKAGLDFSTREVLNANQNKHAKLEVNFGPNMGVCKLSLDDFSGQKFFTSCFQGGGPKEMGEVISHYKAVNGDEGFGEWEVDQVQLLN